MVLSGQYTWSQSQDEIVILVELKGSAPSQVDLYVARNYVKVNFRPYLINIDLMHEVDDMNAVSTAEQGVLKVRLPKICPGVWKSLTCENSKDRKAMQERRIAAVQDKTERMQENAAKLHDRKIDEEKLSTRMQMKTDERERQDLEDAKAEEKQQAEEQVYQVFRELERDRKLDKKFVKDENGPAAFGPSRDRPHKEEEEEDSKKEASKPPVCSSTIISEPLKGILKHESEHENPQRARRVSFSEVQTHDLKVGDNNDENKIFTENDWEVIDSQSTKEDLQPTLETDLVSTQSERILETPASGDDLDKVIPATRKPVRVKMSFTARVFPTPMRESKKEEEEDWLLRNRRHMKGKARQRLDAVDISERDPFWLKGKGDDFFRSGNFEGALNAYTCALELDGSMIPCMSNRAACYLKMGLNERTIEDCDLALNAIEKERKEELDLAEKEGFPEKPKELRRVREMRKKLLLRKGTALSNQSLYSEALACYQKAAELDEQNEELKADCFRLTCLVQCTAQKDLGDTAFKQSDFESAIGHYNRALSLDSESVGCLANRSACHLKLGDTVSMVEDCILALDLHVKEQNLISSKVSGRDSTPDEKKKIQDGRSLELKLLKRLGAGQTKLCQFGDAIVTFKRALEMDSSSLEIAKQIKRLEIALQNSANEDDTSQSTI